jgi:hypothetical protein
MAQTPKNTYSNIYPGYIDKASFLASFNVSASNTDFFTIPGIAGHVRYTVHKLSDFVIYLLFNYYFYNPTLYRT